MIGSLANNRYCSLLWDTFGCFKITVCFFLIRRQLYLKYQQKKSFVQIPRNFVNLENGLNVSSSNRDSNENIVILKKKPLQEEYFLEKNLLVGITNLVLTPKKIQTELQNYSFKTLITHITFGEFLHRSSYENI